MKDIFDSKILCSNCDIEMKAIDIIKSGFRLRAIQCAKCKERIIHPIDLERFNHYSDLKRKTFSVKLRVVGNSHAVSIPKEIVDFINEMNQNFSRNMNEMVRLCFEDFGKLSINFNEGEKIPSSYRRKEQ